MKSVRPVLRYALIASVLVISSVAAVPAARAQAVQAIEDLSGMVFISFAPLPQNSDQPTVIFMEDGEIRQDMTVSLEEARAQTDYSWLLPTWMPDGYVLAEDEVSVISLKDETVALNIKWQKEMEVVLLYVSPAGEEELVVPQGGDVTETEVNGNPAFLMSSEFSISAVPLANGTPGPDIVVDHIYPLVSLSWMQDGVLYTLSGSLSPEDVLRMAESLQ